jgi:hypothetical protein
MNDAKHRFDKHENTDGSTTTTEVTETVESTSSSSSDAVGQPDLDPATEDEKDRVEHHD